MKKFKILICLAAMILNIAFVTNCYSKNPERLSEKKYFELVCKIYKESGMSKGVLDTAHDFIDNYPRSDYIPRVKYIIAECLGDTYDAEKEFSSIASNNSGLQIGASAAYMAAQIYYNQGNYLDAAKYFKKVCESYSGNFIERETLYGLSQAQIGLNCWNDAEASLNKLLNIDLYYEDEDKIKLLSGLVLYNNKRYEDAYNDFLTVKSTASLYYRGRSLEQMQKYIQAAATFKELLAEFPNMELKEEVSFLIAECFYRSADYLSANEEYMKFLSDYPTSSLAENAYYKIGCCKFRKKDYSDSIIELSNFTADYPKSEFAPFAKYLIGESLIAQENFREALSVYGKIITDYPKSEILPRVYYKIGWCYTNQDNYEPAIGIYKQLIVKYPNHDLVPYALYLIAENYGRANDIEESINYYKQVLNQTGKTQELTEATLYMVTKTYYDSKRYQDIISNYHYILNNMTPNTSQWRAFTYLLVADAYYYMGMYKESERVYELVLKNFPYGQPASIAMDGRAWVYVQLKEYDMAEKERQLFNEDTTVTHSTTAAISNTFEIGNIYYNQKKYLDALDIFESFIKDHPEIPLVPDALYSAGRCFYKLEYYSKAIQKWENLVNFYKGHARTKEAMELIADTYFRAQKYDLCINAYQRMIDEMPDSPQAKMALLRIGQSYYNAMDVKKAIDEFEKVINTYPDDPVAEQAIEGIVMASYRISENKADTGLDIEILRKFLEKCPKSKLAEKIQFRLAQRYFEQKDYAKASDEFRKVLNTFSEGEDIGDAQFFMAESLYLSQNYVDAVPVYKRFIKNFNTHPSARLAYLHFANSLFYLNEFIDAAQTYETLTKISKEEDDIAVTALLNSALSYKKADKWEEAVLIYEQFIKKYPKNAAAKDVIIDLVHASETTKQYDKAISAYREILKGLQTNDPLIPEIKYKISDLYFKLNNTDSAVDELKSMEKISPSDDSWRLTGLARLAEEYERQINLQEAVDIYKNIIKSTNDQKWITAADEKIRSIQATSK